MVSDFLAAPPQGAVVSGPDAALSDVVRGARGNYAAAKRSDRLTGIEAAADLRAAAANSGANSDNAIRSRVASLLLNPKQRTGFNREEIAALERVAKGNFTRNSARILGNLLGGGGGLGAALTAAGGAYAAGPMGAAAPLAGVGAKSLANYLARRSLGSADELVRMRSPLYEALLAQQPATSGPSPAARDALARALIGAGYAITQ